MAGGAGYSPRMAVKKNKYIEEWNGRREITTQSFELSQKNVGKFLLYIVFIPYGIYTAARTEMIHSGERRYQDVL